MTHGMGIPTQKNLQPGQAPMGHGMGIPMGGGMHPGLWQVLQGLFPMTQNWANMTPGMQGGQFQPGLSNAQGYPNNLMAVLQALLMR